MPPIPPTLEQVLLDVISSIHRRKKDLFEFQIPRLRECKGPLSVQQQYIAEIRDDTENITRQIEELDVAAEDQNRESNRQLLRKSVEELQQDLISLKKETRTALLASKRNMDAMSISNREELLRSSAILEKKDLNEKVNEDALMRANNDVTEALRRTVGLMQGELERSVLSTQMLDASTATLRSTSSMHDVLDSVLITSKHLITALEKADKLDRLLILTGLVFFFLVVLFILKQRVLDRGLRIALFWTRFIPRKSVEGDAVVNQIERGDFSATVTTLASVVTSVTTTLATSISSLPSSTETIVPKYAWDQTLTSIITDEVALTVESTSITAHDEL